MFQTSTALRRTAVDSTRAAVLLLACILLVLYREDAAHGVLAGISVCLNLLVPSLFPFVIFACLLTRSRAVQFLCRPLSPVLRHVLHLPGCAAPVLLCGLSLGYPIGAKLTASLYADGRLTRREAVHLLCCCTAPGYAFSVFVGTQLSQNPACGTLLFAACLIAPLILALCLAPFFEKPAARPEPPVLDLPFTEAVRDGVSAMISMCGFLVVFSGLIAVLQSAGWFRAAAAILSRLGMTVPAADTALCFLLEVTSGVTQCAYWQFSPCAAAFGLGFAGLCIHLQILSFFAKTGFPLRFPVYLFTRVINGFICAAVYTVLCRLFPGAVETAAAGAPLARVYSGSPALSASLLALSFFFLVFCAQRSPKTDRICR